MALKRTLSQLIRYSMTGGTAAIVDLSVFSAICPVFLPVAPAATLSFVMSAAVNYTLSSIFVFKAGFGTRRFLMFFMVAAAGLVFNVTVTVLVVNLASAPPPIAKAVGIGTAFLLNFWLNTAVVFRQRRSVKALAGEGKL